MAVDAGTWPLAAFGLAGRDARRLDEVRQRSFPKAAQMDRLRHLAAERGIDQIQETELALNEGDRHQFWLEHGPTSTRAGRVSVLQGRSHYVLMWLLDGRTYELFRANGNESWLIFADAREVGACTPTESKRTLLVFRFANAWRIDIGDEHAMSYRELPGRRPTVLITLRDGREVPAWSGMPNRRDLPSPWPSLARDLGLRRSPVENRLWFLPRDTEDRPLPESHTDLIALVAMSMLIRRAFSVPEGD
jgi:hypothetical protein